MGVRNWEDGEYLNILAFPCLQHTPMPRKREFAARYFGCKCQRREWDPVPQYASHDLGSQGKPLSSNGQCGAAVCLVAQHPISRDSRFSYPEPYDYRRPSKLRESWFTIITRGGKIYLIWKVIINEIYPFFFRFLFPRIFELLF